MPRSPEELSLGTPMAATSAAASGGASAAGGSGPPSLPGPADAPATGAAPRVANSGEALFEALLHAGSGTGALRWRRRALVVAALAACVLVFWLARTLAAVPTIGAEWRIGVHGELILESGNVPALRGLNARSVQAIGSPGGAMTPVDGALLFEAARWQVDAGQRQRQIAQQRAVARHLEVGRVTLQFADGTRVEIGARARGFAGLGWLFWPLAASGLALALLGAVILATRPRPHNALFFVICIAQAGNLLFIAMHSAPGLGWAQPWLDLEFPLRVAFDACSAAAALHAFALHPLRLPRWRGIATAAWLIVAMLAAVLNWDRLAGVPGNWWLVQGTCAALVLAALLVASRSHRLQPNPYVVVLRRFLLVILATWALVTVTVAAAARLATAAAATAAVASALWTLFIGSLILLTPFLSRSRQVLREFALLAGISTVATSLDLLFVALFSLGPFTSLTLAVFLALAVYAGVRQWLINHMFTGQVLTTERTFDQILRMSREVQAQPARYVSRAAQLLRELFEPMETTQLDHALPQARVVGNGAALAVPVTPPGHDATEPVAVVLRFARRGQRLFTHDDARLADRVIDQLRRAVEYDQAVERGRTEERLRIAQDLHDDIGARLLTLMYKAETPEMEDYVRNTLKDLKTLTRGLSAREHRLSHAAAEWKADIAQRLAAAHVELSWNLAFDHDVRLGVVQWSALTRILRELISNVVAHALATRVDITLQLERGRLELEVGDDGLGGDPALWSHGLGLGGVRKRVKQLDGEVHWRRRRTGGIVCEVRVPRFALPE